MDADDHARAAKHHDRQRRYDDGDLASDKTLLDHFAGLAMKRILAAPIDAPSPEHAAEQAYRYAHAMVAEKRRLEG